MAGVSGIVLIVGALVLTMIFNVGFHFKFDPDFNGAYEVAKDLVIVMFSIVAGFFAALWLCKKVITFLFHRDHLAVNVFTDFP